MAHWAKLDENNTVTWVVVGSNDDPDEGYQWLIDNLGGRWVQTSYNSYGGVHYKTDENGVRTPSGKPHFRYNYAAIGYSYDEKRDAFIPPKPPMEQTLVTKKPVDWVLDEETCLWNRVVLD